MPALVQAVDDAEALVALVLPMHLPRAAYGAMLGAALWADRGRCVDASVEHLGLAVAGAARVH